MKGSLRRLANWHDPTTNWFLMVVYVVTRVLIVYILKWLDGKKLLVVAPLLKLVSNKCGGAWAFSSVWRAANSFVGRRFESYKARYSLRSIRSSHAVTEVVNSFGG